MDTGIQNHTEHFVHDISNPSALGLCPEMLQVAEEACRAGDFDLAVEIYSSQLADLHQPDRGLCLRKADTLARAGRIGDALDSYRVAANIQRLLPDELGLLVESIARTIRGKELSDHKTETSVSGRETAKTDTLDSKASGRSNNNGATSGDRDGSEEEECLDLFTCKLCKCLLSEPTTLECGHTFCKRCLEDTGVKECSSCHSKINNSLGEDGIHGFRVNVVLSSLLDKWFESESKSRRFWLEADGIWKKHDLANALEKFNKAVEIAPSICRLLGRRAELHMEMRNFSQAIQDADSVCRLKPQCPKARYTKAKALSGAGRAEEALQQYFYCVALKPDWTVVKLEAQKVLSELFSSVFEEDGLSAPLPSRQTGPSSRLKPSSLLNSLPPSYSTPGSSKDSSATLPKSGEGSVGTGSSSLPLGKADGQFENPKSLSAVLSALPCPSSLKRKGSTEHRHAPPCKHLRPDGSSSSTAVTTSSGVRQVPTELLDSGDLECSLCMRLFYEPVTTRCGHTFCLKCLERCMDHNPNCPLCKENLSESVASRGYSKTFLMEEVLQRYLGEELGERRKVHEEEMKELSNLNQEVPIFICTMAFPTIPCPLHVFEPRYRLMIRRSMETGTKQFGMCIADDVKGFAAYGCMLEVKDVKFFPDGRSVVDTVGVDRFKVLSHGQRDGYHTAKIEYLEDKKAEGDELAELQKLHDSVYDQANTWFTSLRDNMKSQILSHFGHLPTKDHDPQANPSGPAWCWWLLAVLPLENRAQLTILAMTSLKDRLIAIRRVLIFVTRKRPR
ncbi:LON peptidase N-terminal domain and RING finger protein 2 [Clupea harengus]|uniref:LON peptidase N-terminal domain and RING finger protein 2 n=1 Tax=Clupea harengus TaxID=7950 RepID=A0A6P3VMP4_CLUHA|nr:LON peptidase N-terminal domain and RING finger protein 2 [Clupea harengus]